MKRPQYPNMRAGVHRRRQRGRSAAGPCATGCGREPVAVADWRFWRSQISDSGTSRRIQKHDQRGQHADEEHGAPAEARQHERRRRRPRSSRRWPSVDCIRPSALARCSAGQVSAMSAAPVVHSPPMPRPRTKRQIASSTIVWERPQAPLATRVDEDRDHQRARAADAVGQEAEAEAADGGGEQRERVQQPALRLAHPEVAHEVREHHRVEHHVHGVEHPAEPARDQSERRSAGVTCSGHSRSPSMRRVPRAPDGAVSDMPRDYSP